MAVVRRQVNPRWAPDGEVQPDLAPKSPEWHLIIAGTGRAGTSFLVRYLTELGLDTTLARNGDRASWDADANAGLENQLVCGANLPYVVKSPWIGEYVDQILNERQLKIDAFIGARSGRGRHEPGGPRTARNSPTQFLDGGPARPNMGDLRAYGGRARLFA